MMNSTILLNGDVKKIFIQMNHNSVPPYDFMGVLETVTREVASHILRWRIMRSVP